MERINGKLARNCAARHGNAQEIDKAVVDAFEKLIDARDAHGRYGRTAKGLARAREKAAGALAKAVRGR